LLNGQSDLLSELDNCRCVDLSLIFEAQLNKVVIVVESDVDPVRFMLGVVVRGEDFDLSWRILFGIWVL
jgi:hypothetical protein